jgi:hypothetical protein
MLISLTITTSTIYFIPDPELYCDLDGLVCLGKYLKMFTTRKVTENSIIQGFYCPCVDTCDAMTIEFVHWVQDVNQKWVLIMSEERCVGSVFFDIFMFHWANVMNCSKAKCTLFACVTEYSSCQTAFKKKNLFFTFHGVAFMGKWKFIVNLMSTWLYLTSTNKFNLFWLHYVEAFNTSINQYYFRRFADKTCTQTCVHSLPIFCAKIKLFQDQ